VADSIFGRNSYLQDSMDALKRLPAGVLRRLSDTPEQVARGVLGPAYRPTMAAANIMGPQADVAGMVRDAEVGNRLFGQGKYGPALANYGMAAAAVPFMFLPGTVSMMPKGASRTDTGWTFRDVKHPQLTKADNRAANLETASPETVVLPIRSLNATQTKVNPDFADPISSEPGSLPLVVKKGGEYFVRDGHHRIAAVADEGGQNVRTRLIDLDKTDKTAPLLDWQPVTAKQRADDDALLEALGGRGRGVDIETTKRGNVLEISKIKTPSNLRGQGLADQQLEQLINQADADGITLALTPSSAFGANKARLTKWYKRHGFVPNKGRNKDFSTRESMVRPPKATGLGINE